MFTMLTTKIIVILTVYAETLTWHWNFFCASYPIENNQEAEKSIVKRQLYQIPTWNSQSIVSPFSSVWSYQSSLTPSHFLTPYYLIDLPNQNYRPYNPENRSYQFKFDTGNFRKQESSNENGNVQGCFEYEDREGRHDLRYFSNDRGGFQATGGSLAGSTNSYSPVYTSVNKDRRNQTNIGSTNQTKIGGNLNYPFEDTQPNNPSINNLTQSLQQLSNHLNRVLDSYYSLPYSTPRNRSYHFCFDSGNYKTEEKSDEYGNIRGYFRYVDETGLHDLEYLTTPQRGFQIIGGNLAQRETQNNRGIQVNENHQSRDFEEVPIVIGQNTERVTELPQS